MAGALTTIAMLKGEQGLAWLDLQNVAYLAVDHAGTVTENLTMSA
jgi:hypothetical protein